MRTVQQEILSRLMLSKGGQSIEMIGKCVGCFYDSDNVKIYEAIAKCVERGIVPDALSVVKAMKDLKTFDRRHVGIISELATLDLNNTSTFENLCSEALDQKRQRLVRNLSADAINKIDSGTFTVEKYIEQSKELEVKLSSNSTKERSSKDVILDLVERHNRAKNGDITGIQLGFTNLDSTVILEPVDMMVVAGRPAMGKSAFGVSCFRRTVFNQGLKVAFFSLEMSTESVHRRLISEVTEIGMNAQKMGNCSQAEIERIEAFAESGELENLYIFEGSKTVNEIRRICTDLKYTKGCDLIIIDYLQKIKSNKHSRYEEVTAISGGVKEMAMDLRIPVIALAQLSRASELRGGDKRPVLSDLKGSGSIEQDASIVAFLHRPEYYGHMQDENEESTEGKGEFIIAKNREGETKIVTFEVDLGISRWTELETDIVISNTLQPNQDFDEEIPF